METKMFWGTGKLIRLAFLLSVLFACIQVMAIKNPSGRNKFPSLSLFNEGSALAEFRSQVNNNHEIELLWQTVSPGDYTYVIEKSRDGEHFSPVKSNHIRKVGEAQFSWTDEDSKKFINCYRIRVTDTQGEVSYSKVMVVNLFKYGEVSMVGVTPDLSKNDLQVNIQMEELAYITFNITDKDGNITLQKKVKGTAGMNSLSFEGTHELKPGEYFLHVIINGSNRLMVHLIKS